MQDQKDNKPSNSSAESAAAATTAANRAAQSDFVQKIVEKIRNSENILVALSKDPSVDEIAAAVGLALYLDGMQKHTTAIYSGRTPDALLFLKPGDTFETNTDSLQDFIIALNKDKADHLRYKLEGDYVKVFITPYKSTISEKDLQFSHGEYNVDFVIAMNVPSAGNLDDALRDHASIMHDASAVNITTGKAGRFGEIEWSNPAASSLCEMVTELIFAIQGNDEKPLEKDVATALLTGIVAATDRFSNNRTTPETLGVASKLMSMGADQQLITTHVKGNEVIHNEPGQIAATANAPVERTKLDVDHGGPAIAGAGISTPAGVNPVVAGVSANPAVQQAPRVNTMANPSPTAVSATNDAKPEDVVVQPVIPGGGKAPADPGQMQIPNTPVMQATPYISDPVAAHRAIREVEQAAAVDAAVAKANAGVASGVGAGGVAGTSMTSGVSADSAAAMKANPGQMQIPNTPVMQAAPAATSNVSTMAIPGMNPGMGGASTNVTSGAEANSAPDGGAARPMAVSEPVQQTEKQVGSTLQPPQKQPAKPKNYAEMMEEALAEPLPNAMGNAPVGVPMSTPVDAGAVSLPTVDNSLAASASTGGAPGSVTGASAVFPSSVNNMPAAGSPSGAAAAAGSSNGVISTPAAPAMEPVSNPMSGILPPPPSPTAGMDVPPALPPVQM